MISLTPSHPDLALRPATPDDRDFLCALYRSTRLEELSVTGWPQQQIDAFLAQQFDAQTAHYDQHYADATRWVIQAKSKDVGRLYVTEYDHDLRIVDIALLPEHRSGGFGTSLLNDLLDLAGPLGKTVSIHVEENNPAQSLYQRLGFRKIDEHGVYHLMECHPQPANA